MTRIPFSGNEKGSRRALKLGTFLFVVGGVFDAFIGAATPIVIRVFGLAPIGAFLISARTDANLLGVSPAQLVQAGSPAAILYGVMIDLVGFLLFAFGSFQVGVAWFGLRRRQAWALWTLIVVDLIFIAGWMVVLSHYFLKGIYPSLGELPPNFLVPAILLVPASLLAYAGLMTSKQKM